MKLRTTEALLDALHEHTILLKHNCPPPFGGTYGWARAHTDLVLHTRDLAIEESCGLYGGTYKPLVGGRKSSGFASSGAFSYSYSMLPEGFAMGRYCSISSGLRFLDSTHPSRIVTTSAISFRPKNKLFERWITPDLAAFAADFDVRGAKAYPRIGHDVWIGADVTLAMGITIGTGAIVASGSVVTRDVAPYAVVAGNPGTVKKSRFEPALAERLLASRWWELDPGFVFSHEFTDPEALCARIERDRASIAPFVPRVFDVAAFALACRPLAEAA